MGKPFDAEKGAPVGERGPGRPRKMTDAVRAALLELLRKSVTRKDACAAIGLSVQTLANEIKRDPDFKAQVHQAEAEGIVGASDCITRHAAADPKYALEFLQRKRPKEWGKKKLITIEPRGTPRTGREIVEQLMEKLGAGPEPAAAGSPVDASAPAPAPSPAGGAMEASQDSQEAPRGG